MYYEKNWGGYEILHQKEDFTVKLLTFAPDMGTSKQRHMHRGERWIVVEGELFVRLWNDIGEFELKLPALGTATIQPKDLHQLTAGKDGAKVVEVMFGRYDENDIERFYEN
jgi:mannose-1-phosphate guanylyltransferase/mannose-6-phosphate isomerase